MADLFDIVVARKLSDGGGGGGGSSDFSTATVTVVNNANADVNILGALIDHDAINYSITVPHIIFNTLIIEAVLYKTEGLIVVDAEANITVSGDAELDETSVIITGDCTITVNALA